MSLPKRLLVTGGAGFIGSAFVRNLLLEGADVEITVLDKLTYAGNVANLEPVASHPGYRFVRGDINDGQLVTETAAEVDAIVNFAAESHVDRSIESPDSFIQTDVHGAFTLLEAARHRHHRFVQVSTDEVYGDVPTGATPEDAALRPHSPYAASKAAGDLLALAYWTTFGLPVNVTRGSNTYGPYQYPEKVIPLFVTNAIDDEPLPLYGDGAQVRDWLHVDDHCAAIRLVLESGVAGETYNIGGGTQLTNIALTRRILELLEKPTDLIRHVRDRAGHDRRYSVDTAKIRSLGWRPRRRFDDGLAETVRWYAEHSEWWRPLKTQEYMDYYRRQYEARLAASRALG